MSEGKDGGVGKAKACVCPVYAMRALFRKGPPGSRRQEPRTG